MVWNCIGPVLEAARVREAEANGVGSVRLVVLSPVLFTFGTSGTQGGRGLWDGRRRCKVLDCSKAQLSPCPSSAASYSGERYCFHSRFFHKLLSILSEPGKAEALSVPFQNIFAVGSGWLNCKDSVVKQKSSSFLHFFRL